MDAQQILNEVERENKHGWDKEDFFKTFYPDLHEHKEVDYNITKCLKGLE